MGSPSIRSLLTGPALTPPKLDAELSRACAAAPACSPPLFCAPLASPSRSQDGRCPRRISTSTSDTGALLALGVGGSHRLVGTVHRHSCFRTPVRWPCALCRGPAAPSGDAGEGRGQRSEGEAASACIALLPFTMLCRSARAHVPSTLARAPGDAGRARGGGWRGEGHLRHASAHPHLPFAALARRR